MDDIKSDDYTPGELRMALRAIRRVLNATTGKGQEHALQAMKDTAIHIGLITDNNG